MTTLRITESKNGSVSLVCLAGRIDNTSTSELMSCLKNLISSGEKNILVDFAGVMYLTSAGFRVLLVAADEADRNAAQLILCGVTGHVHELFEMGGLIDAFAIVSSREDALARFQ